MGKTNSPMKLLVDVDIVSSPEIQELIAKGHEVLVFSECYDGILSGRAWYMPVELLKYLPIALKEMRRRKKDAQDPKEDSPRRKPVPKGRAR